MSSPFYFCNIILDASHLSLLELSRVEATQRSTALTLSAASWMTCAGFAATGRSCPRVSIAEVKALARTLKMLDATSLAHNPFAESAQVQRLFKALRHVQGKAAEHAARGGSMAHLFLTSFVFEPVQLDRLSNCKTTLRQEQGGQTAAISSKSVTLGLVDEYKLTLQLRWDGTAMCMSILQCDTTYPGDVSVDIVAVNLKDLVLRMTYFIPEEFDEPVSGCGFCSVVDKQPLENRLTEGLLCVLCVRDPILPQGWPGIPGFSDHALLNALSLERAEHVPLV